MPGAHGPAETWVELGVEVRVKNPATGLYETTTVVGVDKAGVRVGVNWKDGGVGIVGLNEVHPVDPPRPVLLQSASPLFLDSTALARTECAQRLTRQYTFRNTQTRRAAAAAEKTQIECIDLPKDFLKNVSQEPLTNVPRTRRIVRCPCGWNRIATPMMIKCKTCECWVHCVCVGLRSPDDPPSHTILCTFCDYGWMKPTEVLPNPPTSVEGDPYQVPLDLMLQRFHPTSVPTQKTIFHTIQTKIKSKLLACGYHLEQIPGGKHGALDCDAAVQECVDVCGSAIAEGYFDHRYPQNAFTGMRGDSCSRVTILRDTATGKAVSVLASSGNDCPLVLQAACVALQRAIGDKNAHRYIDTSDLETLRRHAGVKSLYRVVHLSLVATNTAHRQKGLGKLLMLHDLCSWAAEGRTQMYLNMTLLRKTVATLSKKPSSKPDTKVIFYYSTASKMLYERFGFRLVYPRKPFTKPHPLLPDEVGQRCKWTDREVNNGVLMMNTDMWGDIFRNYNEIFPEHPPMPVPKKEAMPYGHKPYSPPPQEDNSDAESEVHPASESEDEGDMDYEEGEELQQEEEVVTVVGQIY